MRPEADIAVKPLLRGWSHQVAFFVALGAGAFLISAAPTTGRALIAAIYVLSLMTMYGVSALYHRPKWQPKARALMRRLDHSAIFVLIAGTYTPFCLLGFERQPGLVLLVVVWTGAVVGIVQKIVFPDLVRWLSAAPYVVLGWAAPISIPFATPIMGADAVAFLIAGGLAYTVGALVYASRRPNPAPLVFGYHEIFHVFVIVASVLHFFAVKSVVLS